MTSDAIRAHLDPSLDQRDRHILEAHTLFVNGGLSDPVLWGDIASAWSQAHPSLSRRSAAAANAVKKP
jgi:hypothetical protein